MDAGKIDEWEIMKTEYKFIHFEIEESDLFVSSKTVWLCRNIRDKFILARLHYDDGQYIVVFNKEAVFSAGCLADIVAFMEQL